MPKASHHRDDVSAARCVVITVSDTRDLDTDLGGNMVVAELTAAGHDVVGREILADDVNAIRRSVLLHAEMDTVDAIVLTGGTGIGHRDNTPEAVELLYRRSLPGFGEAFRRISYEEIGPAALLSRASAGVVAKSLVFTLPGSPAACALAVGKLIGPMLAHGVGLVRAR